MSPAICRKWLDLCTRVACETLLMEGLSPEASFLHREEDFFAEPMSPACLGLLLQWACENPNDFSRTFEAVLGDGSSCCAFHHKGLTSIVNLVRNGIMDDWDIFAQWTPHGYLIVLDGQQTDADRRFDFRWAPEWLWGRVGGAREPGSEFPELHIKAIELSAESAVANRNRFSPKG